MEKAEALEIIKNSFLHLIYEENLMVNSREVLLYFPTIGIAVLEPKDGMRSHVDNDNIEGMDELYIKKELSAKPVYLDLEEENFSIGYVINDILLEGRFVPLERTEGRSSN